MKPALESAYRLLDASVIRYRDEPIGTVAVVEGSRPPSAQNYAECFVRDFAVSGFAFLADRQPQIVHNFLVTADAICAQELVMEGHELEPGVMPASFWVEGDAADGQRVQADFGDQAIGRVAPVDSMMWWLILLRAYTRSTGSHDLVSRAEFQHRIRRILSLCLRGSFEVFPTLLVPDGAFMIDRRMGVYGHPLEIQALFYGALRAARELLHPDDTDVFLTRRLPSREEALRGYVQNQYWLDLERLSQIHRFRTDEWGTTSANVLNIYPESIPEWINQWMPEQAGYFCGNAGPGRLDTRFFAHGNLLAVVFGLATREQASRILDLYEARWEDLVGSTPLKICYPALEGEEWRIVTGCDRRNAPWCYHNAGTWPVLLWVLVAAALKAERRPLAERAFEMASAKVSRDSWPEYYDGPQGRLTGQHANLNQVWSAAAYIFAHRLLEDEQHLQMLIG